MRARIVVVGGGVMGLSIAYHAARRCDPLSEPVVLLERTELGAGSSGRSGAIVRQQYSDRITAAMARESLRVYASFERNTGRSVGWQQTGVLTVSARPEDIELLRANREMMVELGIDMRVLDAAEVRELVPGIEVTDDTVGMYEPDAGLVDPQATVEAFAALAREAGVVTRLGVEARELLVEDGRVAGVSLADGGEVRAEQVVVAAGPWARAFLARAGVDLPLQVVRPEQHFVRMPETAPLDEADVPDLRATGQVPFSVAQSREEELETRFGPEPLRPAAHPVLLDIENLCYIKCESDQERTRIGRMDTDGDDVVEDPDQLDEEIGAEFSRWARETVEARLPVYRDLPDVGTQACWYTMTPDAQAVIGAIDEVPGLFVATGFSGHGFKFAPSVGEGMGQLLFGEAVSAFDPEFFSPRRFGTGVERSSRGFGL